jgi:hypothetical protein
LRKVANMADTPSIITENAARLRELHDEIHRTYRLGPHGPDHHAACRRFHGSYDALAFPGGLTLGLDRLKRLDPLTVEMAVRFLEEDPWFHRSGYIKEVIVMRLKNALLTEPQRYRLASVVLRSMVKGSGRAARHLARLAPMVMSATFTNEMAVNAEADDAEIISRRGQVANGHFSVTRCAVVN